MEIKLYFGVVIDNNDPLQIARSKVRLLPEMQTVPDIKLPWLEPFFSSGSTSSETMLSNQLEVGSNVWCAFTDDSFLTGWYFSGVFANEQFDFSKVSTQLGDISEFSIGNYKDLRFSRTEDGTISFNNISSGISGTYHNSGSYIVFDASGGITGYSKSNIKLYTDNNSLELEDSAGIVVNSGTGNIEFNGSSDSLVTYMDLASILNFLVMNLDTRINSDPLSGTTTMVMPSHVYITFDPNWVTKKISMEATTLKTS